jgi:hypothetical protein
MRGCNDFVQPGGKSTLTGWSFDRIANEKGEGIHDVS